MFVRQPKGNCRSFDFAQDDNRVAVVMVLRAERRSVSPRSQRRDSFDFAQGQALHPTNEDLFVGTPALGLPAAIRSRLEWRPCSGLRNAKKLRSGRVEAGHDLPLWIPTWKFV